MQDQYANYVCQHLFVKSPKKSSCYILTTVLSIYRLERGTKADRTAIIQQVTGNLVNLSRHKFASNVMLHLTYFNSSVALISTFNRSSTRSSSALTKRSVAFSLTRSCVTLWLSAKCFVTSLPTTASVCPHSFSVYGHDLMSRSAEKFMLVIQGYASDKTTYSLYADQHALRFLDHSVRFSWSVLPTRLCRSASTLAPSQSI